MCIIRVSYTVEINVRGLPLITYAPGGERGVKGNTKSRFLLKICDYYNANLHTYAYKNSSLKLELKMYTV